jgi:iron complex transport system ATP-binding protein
MSAGRPAVAADEPPLEAAGLVFEAGGRRIIDGVGLRVQRGELVGVIGPNGAGKTTLMRLVCGLLAPAAGRVSLSGVPLAGMTHRERARRVAFMSQEIPREVGYPVRDVLMMGRFAYLGRFERESAGDLERVRRMLSYVGLAGFEGRSFGELSGGERQLVLFARVLVQETALIVLDEPSSHLDIRHQDRIFSMAQEMAVEKMAVVVSVHNLNVASHYCSRLVLLDQGRVAAEGAPGEVITPEVLDRVYGVRTVVSRSTATGSLQVSVIPTRAGTAGSRVHLIGGAGSAVNLTRELHRLGCTLSGGIAHEYDSDETLWRNLGLPCSVVGAFSRIAEADIDKAIPLVREAEVTVLCPFPIGPGNLGNLTLARFARKLVILDPGPGDVPRSFFSEEARAAFNELEKRARHSSRDALLSLLMEEAPLRPGGRG